MAGFQSRLNQSVQLKLSLTLSVAIILVAALAGTFSFYAAVHEAHELQDDVLRQAAAMTDPQHILHPHGDGDHHHHHRHPDEEREARVLVQRLDTAAPGAPPAPAAAQGAADPALPIPRSLPDGMQTLDLNGEAYRVLVQTAAGGERIAVAQQIEFRDEIARNSAWRTAMPLLVLLPLLLLIVADLVRKMFKPISAVSQEIDQRGESELHPVDEQGLPVEVRPFAVAINRLLERVAQSMQAQRRFVADAAHELRSPMTALSLQAERLADTEMSDTARERLASLCRGIERGRNLLDQLLSLARANAVDEQAATPVSLQKILRRVLEDLAPLAEAREVDVGVEGECDALVQAGELDVFALVRNLADNAIRYTPQGGRVDLSVARQDDCAILSVEDTGPGIALDERARVFDPFYRTLGSEQIGAGLGLSIVKAIAERIGAQVRLDDAAGASGLKVVVTFLPAAA